MSFDPRVSVRARLVLWNILTLIVILVVFSVGLRFTIEKVLTARMDRQLTELLTPLVRNREGLPPLQERQLGEVPGFRPVDDPGPEGAPPGPDGGPGPEGRPQGQDGAPGPDGIPPQPMPGDPQNGPQGNPRQPQRPPRLKMPPGFYVPHTYPEQAQLATPYSAVALESTDLHENFRNEVYEGVPVRVYTLPIVRGGQIIGVAQNAASLTDLRQAVAGVTTATLYMIPLVLLLAGGGAAALTNSALKPVRDITTAASAIEPTNLSDRLPVEGQDEFAQLSGILNQMIARIETAFARQKRFTADASHELRTPLAVIKANTSMLLDDDTATVDELKDALKTIDSASDRAQRIVQDLLLLARGEAGTLSVQWSPVVLNDVLAVAVKSVSVARSTPMAKIEVIAPPDIRLVSDKDHLTRLFINFIDNAIRHTPVDGRVTVFVTTDNKQVNVAVADTGEGIPAEHLERIMEPFYRVDQARARKSGGAGLGLAICRTIIETFGGKMKFESAPGKGTTVTVNLPLSPVNPLVAADRSSL